MAIIGDRISALLKERNMTQKELSQRACVTESAMSHYIKGDRVPSGDVLANIACVLKTTANYLMGKEDELEYSDVKRILARNKKTLKDEEKMLLIKTLLGGEDETVG